MASKVVYQHLSAIVCIIKGEKRFCGDLGGFNIVTNNIYSAVWGFAIGEALYLPMKIKDRKYIESQSFDDYTDFNGNLGVWSEGTSLMLCGLKYNSLNKKDHKILFNEYKIWINTGKYNCPAMGNDVSPSILMAVSRFDSNISDYGKIPLYGVNDEFLSLIVASVALSNTREEVEDKIVDLISATHNHGICLIAGMILSSFIFELKVTGNKEKALSNTKIALASFINKDMSLASIAGNFKEFVNMDLSDKNKMKFDSPLSIPELVNSIIWTFIVNKDFKSTIKSALRLNSSYARLVPMIGMIAGYFYGINSIPIGYIENLSSKKVILSILADSKIVKINRMNPSL